MHRFTISIVHLSVSQNTAIKTCICMLSSIVILFDYTISTYDVLLLHYMAFALLELGTCGQLIWAWVCGESNRASFVLFFFASHFIIIICFTPIYHLHCMSGHMQRSRYFVLCVELGGVRCTACRGTMETVTWWHLVGCKDLVFIARAVLKKCYFWECKVGIK